MFWNNFVSLCNQNDKTPNGVCSELGLSAATATKWKKGAVPRDTTLQKIADYFQVSTTYLLGVSDDPHILLSEQVIANIVAGVQRVEDKLDKKKKPVLGLNLKLSSLISDMSAEELEDLERYAEFILSNLNLNLSSLISDMSAEELEDLERYAEFILSKKKG